MKEIPLSQGKFALVDDEDFERLNKFKWYAHKIRHGYYANRGKTITINGKRKRKMFYMHRVILDVPKGFVVDHKNGDPLDNRKSNLRIVTHRQNCQNKIHVTKSSKYPGVYRNNYGQNKWDAAITINKKIRFLGTFNEEREAAKAYERACRELVGEELICKASSK